MGYFRTASWEKRKMRNLSDDIFKGWLIYKFRYLILIIVIGTITVISYVMISLNNEAREKGYNDFYDKTIQYDDAGNMIDKKQIEEKEEEI